MTGLRYVYAVCRPFDAALQSQLTGVAGAPPRQLRHHDLIALVSEVPERDFAEQPLRAHLEDLDWLTETARAHQSVIDALTVVTTPLPLRLGTVFRDDSGVRVMLEAREEGFRRTLDRLAGRVEWGVKVYAESEEQGRPRHPRRSPAGATTCGSGGGATGPTRRCGRTPSGSPAGCTTPSPNSRRTPGCTLRRIPRSPEFPAAMC